MFDLPNRATDTKKLIEGFKIIKSNKFDFVFTVTEYHILFKELLK